jgi:hypothetical protein
MLSTAKRVVDNLLEKANSPSAARFSCPDKCCPTTQDVVRSQLIVGRGVPTTCRALVYNYTNLVTICPHLSVQRERDDNLSVNPPCLLKSYCRTDANVIVIVGNCRTPDALSEERRTTDNSHIVVRPDQCTPKMHVREVGCRSLATSGKVVWWTTVLSCSVRSTTGSCWSTVHRLDTALSVVDRTTTIVVPGPSRPDTLADE